MKAQEPAPPPARPGLPTMQLALKIMRRMTRPDLARNPNWPNKPSAMPKTISVMVTSSRRYINAQDTQPDNGERRGDLSREEKRLELAVRLGQDYAPASCLGIVVSSRLTPYQELQLLNPVSKTYAPLLKIFKLVKTGASGESSTTSPGSTTWAAACTASCRPVQR